MNGTKGSKSEQQERKQRVLTHETPSITESIADAIVIKNDNLFFLSKPDGTRPFHGDHGYGLYENDCRFLNGYEFTLGEKALNVLVADESMGFASFFEFTNGEIQVDEDKHIARDLIGLSWERVLDGAAHTLYDLLRFKNYGNERIRTPFEMTFRADFEDVFDIRGLLNEQPGTLAAPKWRKDHLFFCYKGADGLYRSLTLYFSLAPGHMDGTHVRFELDLKPLERKELLIAAVAAQADKERETKPKAQYRPDPASVRQVLNHSPQNQSRGMIKVHSESLLLNALIDRSLRDLEILTSHMAHDDFFAAGLPWFATLFGRDSIITALQTLAFDREIAEQTLRLLARYQGRAVNAWRDEQPGKILHELRVGELANLREIPHTPYYGSIDATPLFLVLIARHAAWSGDLSLFHELQENIERALEWIDRYGDSNGDGYVDYASTTERGLINQGWKDSGDAIVTADGKLARPPIALVEVQGYVYQAKLGMADLYERAGHTARAQALRQEAQDLGARFNHDFWEDQLGFYALCLQGDGKPAAVISSNPGHALWSGIVDEDKAGATVERLLSDEMFSGWGIRTLATAEKRYNPLGYHLGTVWPHDNGIIMAGLRRYGFDQAARRLAGAILAAAIRFDMYRLPELFAGIERGAYSVPVRYPVACHPQAWAAGTIPFLLEQLLGLRPEAFGHRLRVVRPMLPDFVDRLELRGIRVGGASGTLAFERTPGNTIAVQVLEVTGDLHVIIEPSEPGADR